MKVFVSWSGDRGRGFAEAVCALLSGTHGQARLEPWMSTRIRHGKPWAVELLGQLAQCQACIVCLTADTVGSRWLAFEAGAVIGAGSNPRQIVGLGLDLEPGMLEGHALERFDLFDSSLQGMQRVWKRLRPGEDPPWAAEEWRRFEAACAAIPAPATRAFTIILYSRNGLFIHPFQSVSDARLDDVLSQLLDLHDEHTEAEQRAAFRCLDLDAGEWIPMPRRTSLVRPPRVAFLHPDVIRERGDDARTMAMQLRESIDVIPKVEVARAVLMRDLRDLAATQSAWKKEHGRFAGSLEEMKFLPAPGNQLHLIAGEGGFAAQGICEGVPLVYGVRAGDGAGHFADQPEGEVFLVGMAD